MFETLRPTTVAIAIYRGQDNPIVLTVLENGLPKDMSAYASLVPMIRFCDKPKSAGGIVPGSFAQAQLNSGNDGLSNGHCIWLNGGVGGQIEVILPELDLTGGVYKGTRNAAALPASGVFDIQVRSIIDLATIGATTVGAGEGTVNAYNNAQRAITGTWTIDAEVTDL